MCCMCFVQSLDGDALSVIENPAAVDQRFHSESTAGVAVTKGEPGWLKGIRSRSYSKTNQKHTATGGEWEPKRRCAQSVNSNVLSGLVRCECMWIMQVFAYAFTLCINVAPDPLLASGVINYSHNCHFSSQTAAAVGSCVCSWTPGRLRCRCLVSRWVTALLLVSFTITGELQTRERGDVCKPQQSFCNEGTSESFPIIAIFIQQQLNV